MAFRASLFAYKSVVTNVNDDTKSVDFDLM